MKITVKQMLLEFALSVDAKEGDPEVAAEKARTWHNFSTYTDGRYTDEGDTALLKRLYHEAMEWHREVLRAKGPRW